MADTLQVQIKDPGLALTEKERNLVDCLVMRVCVHHLYRRLAKPFRIHRAKVDAIHLLVNHSVLIDGGISPAEARLVMPTLAKDIRQTLAACDVVIDDVLLTLQS